MKSLHKSPHSLMRLTNSLYGKPHLIDKLGYTAISSFLDSRNFLMTPDKGNKEECDDGENEAEDNDNLSFDSTLGIGVINIHGPITCRTSGWEAMCGGYSYEMLLDETEEMLVSGVKTIIMNCDSGGGEAYKCFETADSFRKLLDDYQAQAFAYVDGRACSAMYALAVACDEVICNPQGEAGSIGVLIALCNGSEHDKMEGYQMVYITDGEQKVPFADDGSFKPEFLDDLQSKVSVLGQSFREHVSKYTGLSTDNIKALQAKTFLAQDALSLGLVNSVKTTDEFMKYVVSKHKEKMNA